MLLLAVTPSRVAALYNDVDLGASGGEAAGINNTGQIIGWAYSSSEDVAVFRTNSSSTPVLLNTLGGSTIQADTINSSGQIVGFCSITGGVPHAVLWSNSSSAALDLNTVIPGNSGWVLYQATAINDSGEIVGYGRNPQEEEEALTVGIVITGAIYEKSHSTCAGRTGIILNS